MICAGCQREFEPKRSDQKYHSPKCRQDHYAANLGDGALRGAVSRVSLLKGGKVSVVLTFLPIDRDNALQVMPGSMVEVLRP